MDNAIKYTGEGGLIAASVRRTERHVELEVRDTGIGIAPEELSNIFNRFYRADSSRNRDIGGNGLGLAIAKMDRRRASFGDHRIFEYKWREYILSLL